jgi:hypothetical protein
MATTHVAAAYDYFLSFILEKATPEDILAFELPESERQRAIVLLERQDDDTLTPEEASELEQMLRIDGLISVLKARAIAALSQDDSGI